MHKNLFAYTAPGSNYPPYVSVKWPSSFVWWRGRNSFFPTSTKCESRLAGTPCFCYGNSEAAALKETRGIRSGGKWHTVWQPTDELVIGTCGKAIL